MAISNITYYVSVNNPNLSLLDSNSNATTSVSTSAVSVPIAHINNSSLYSISTLATTLGDTNDVKYITYINYAEGTSQEPNYFKVWDSTYTLGVSLPSDYTYGTTNLATYTRFSYCLTPPIILTSGGGNVLRAVNKVDLYTKGTYTYKYSSDYFTVNDGTSTAQLVRYLSANDFSTTGTGTTSMTDAYSYSYFTLIPTNSGYRFNSSSYDNKTWYSSYSNSDTLEYLSETFQYSADSNNIYTQLEHFSSKTWWRIRQVLNSDVINSTSWTQITGNFTETNSTTGIIADENGNVAYGSMSGLGPRLLLSADGYNYRPAAITSFSKYIDVSTVDTSWFGTYSTRVLDAGTSRTINTYIEYNNYGIGGTISSGTYTWHTYTRSEYSESSRTSTVYLYASRLGTYLSVTIPVANRVSVNVSDNSCPFMSSVKESTTSTILVNSGTVSTSAGSELASTSSELINRTSINLYTTLNVNLYASAYNNYVSVTNTYSASGTVLSTSRYTTFLETTETSSCRIESSTGQNGYSYYTTFYGEMANRTFYATSWVNSAVVSSSTSVYGSSLTMSTIGYTNKTFGDIVNKTTIHDESIISSKIYRTSSVNSMVTSLVVESYTSKSVNVPVDYFITDCTSYMYYTEYHTYTGPKIISNYTSTSYDFNVSVTEIGSSDTRVSKGAGHYTSSVINTIDYGGTTYRLSDLISSSSWFNTGNLKGTVNYLYNYDVKSMFSLNDIIITLSNYTTVLATSYSVGYGTAYNYDTYSVTKSTSLAARTTGERFIDRVGISRTSTIDYEVSNQVAVYNGSTLATLNSSASSYGIQSVQDVSTVARTFISSTADLDTTTEIASSDTATSARGSFIYSSRELVSSMTEQQNDTLIFASTFNTYSFYNSTYTTSTLNTVASTLSATTYEDWYDPISWTSTALSIATATSAAETVYTTSGSVVVTQSITYTPVYSTVDGVYVTA